MLRWVVGVRRWGRVAADQESTEDSGSGVDYDIEGTETTTEDEAETFVEWIQRATGVVREHMEKAHVEDWIQSQRQQKWRWAGHIARRSDERWSAKILDWELEAGRRGVGHPRMRWEDSINEFLQAHLVDEGYTNGEWRIYAQDREAWTALEEQYARG